MPLPKLSRLFRDAAKNLSATASPVARVPVTLSGVFDSRVSCVSAFGSPARSVRPGRSCGMSRWAPLGPSPDLELPVAGRPPHSRLSLLAPTSRLSTLDCQLLTLWPLLFSLSPLQSALTQKRTAKSFRIHSYKFIGLKVPWNDTLTKNTGGGGGSFSLPTSTFTFSVSRMGLRDTCRFLVSRMGLRDNSRLLPSR